MSGHSKWSTIKRKKGALDAKRGKIFTRVSKEITIAVKEGGSGDIDANSRLRLAIQNAKGVNMPKDNVERAIKKGLGVDAESYIAQNFEGYASHGVAVFVECLTDNQNRTVQDVRSVFNKYDGSLGTNGSLEFVFDRKGVFAIQQPESLDIDDFELGLIDAGAEDVILDNGFITVYSQMEDFGLLNKTIESLGIECENAELMRIPNNTKELDNESFLKVMRLIDALEDLDDVQKVWHNLEIKERQESLLN